MESRILFKITHFILITLYRNQIFLKQFLIVIRFNACTYLNRIFNGNYLLFKKILNSFFGFVINYVFLEPYNITFKARKEDIGFREILYSLLK